jgi:hypothetical protein
MTKQNLFQSTFEGSLQPLQSEFENHPSIINSVDEDKRTLLHWAGMLRFFLISHVMTKE